MDDRTITLALLGDRAAQKRITERGEIMKVPEEKKILDVTCGGRSIWFNKRNPAAIYCDKRREEYHNLWKNAGNCTLSIDPDVICNFTALPFSRQFFPVGGF